MMFCWSKFTDSEILKEKVTHSSVGGIVTAVGEAPQYGHGTAWAAGWRLG